MDEELKQYVGDKTKTALVIWDVQNMLVERIFNKDEFLAANQKLIDAAHANDIPVIFSKITQLPERFQSAATKMMMKRRNLQWTPEGLDLYIKATENDVVIPKNTPDFFIGTNFEMMLRNVGITTLVFTGIATQAGVETTARSATARGFFPVIAKDAVSSFDKGVHDLSLQNMASQMMTILSTEEIINLWK